MPDSKLTDAEIMRARNLAAAYMMEPSDPSSNEIGCMLDQALDELEPVTKERDELKAKLEAATTTEGDDHRPGTIARLRISLYCAKKDLERIRKSRDFYENALDQAMAEREALRGELVRRMTADGLKVYCSIPPCCASCDAPLLITETAWRMVEVGRWTCGRHDHQALEVTL